MTELRHHEKAEAPQSMQYGESNYPYYDNVIKMPAPAGPKIDAQTKHMDVPPLDYGTFHKTENSQQGDLRLGVSCPPGEHAEIKDISQPGSSVEHFEIGCRNGDRKPSSKDDVTLYPGLVTGESIDENQQESGGGGKGYGGGGKSHGGRGRGGPGKHSLHDLKDKPTPPPVTF